LEHLWGTNLSKQGVGPDFSLLTACYPYLARRLLTDDNPRAQDIRKIHGISSCISVLEHKVYT